MTGILENLTKSENSFAKWKLIDTTLLLVITGTFLAIYWFSKRYKTWFKERARLIELASKLPGPPTLPLLGNALYFACRSEEILDRIVQMMEENEITPMRFWMGPKLFVILTEPRDYEVILGSQKASYKDPIYRFMKPFVGDGLVSGSGPYHRSQRKLIMPMLNGKALNVFLDFFNSHSRVCADLLDKKVDSGEFNLHPYIVHCTFDIIYDTVLGVPGKSQAGDYKELVEITEAMYILTHTRMVKIWLHPDWIFSLTNLAKHEERSRKIIHGGVESIIEQKKNEHAALKRGDMVSDRPRVMLLEQMIEHIAKTDSMTDKELRDQIYTIFTAAQDTTASIATFALLHLAMDQDIQEKVREEINDVVRNDNVSVENLSELKYTELVLKEAIRFYPIAPLMVRQVTGDIELETCTIPKGCSIVMVPHVTHRSSKFWSEPEKFIPERHLSENSKNRHPYAFVPFSNGLRGCVGQKFAMMLMKTILIHIIRKYRLSTKKKIEDIRLRADISVRLIGEYSISLTRV